MINSDDFKPIWFNVAPVVFTTKVAAAGAAVDALEAFCTEQGLDIRGVTLDKGTEESKLEDLAHKLSRVLVSYFRDQNNQSDAGKVNLKLYQWRGLRDEALMTTATTVRDLANGIVTGDPAEAANAATYGITAAAVTVLSDELAVWNQLIIAPQQAISKKKGLGNMLGPKFNAVSLLMHDLDDVILQYDSAPGGKNMIAAWKAARIVRDLGHGPKPPTPPTP